MNKLEKKIRENQKANRERIEAAQKLIESKLLFEKAKQENKIKPLK